MKPERKHEVPHHDDRTELEVLLSKFAKFCQENAAVVGTVAVTAVLGVVGYNLLATEKPADAPAGPWGEYINSLTDPEPEKALSSFVGTAASDKNVQNWTKLALADKQLEKGASLLYEDRTAADEMLAKAKENYQALVQEGNTPEMRDRARLGLAQVFESQNNLEDAAKYYEMIMKAGAESAYGKAATRAHKRVTSQSNRDFVAWFANQKPIKRPASKSRGDLKNVPETPDFSLPGLSTEAGAESFKGLGTKAKTEDDKPAGDATKSNDDFKPADEAAKTADPVGKDDAPKAETPAEKAAEKSDAPATKAESTESK